MTQKLTFKEYYEQSKRQLRHAAQTIPTHTVEYVVNTYCKLPLGETRDVVYYVQLKPQNHILVEWTYPDLKPPTISSIKFENVLNTHPDDMHVALWSDSRVKRWLDKNTTQLM